MASDNWIEWTGGKCPVGPNEVVQVQYRPLHPSRGRGVSTPAKASFFSIGQYDWWKHESPNRSNDIVAYRPVSA